MNTYTVYDRKLTMIGERNADSRQEALVKAAEYFNYSNPEDLLVIEQERARELEKLKCALLDTGSVEMTNAINYNVYVSETEDDEYNTVLRLSVANGGLPPHSSNDFPHHAALVDELFDDFFMHPPFEWTAIQDEDE